MSVYISGLHRVIIARCNVYESVNRRNQQDRKLFVKSSVNGGRLVFPHSVKRDATILIVELQLSIILVQFYLRSLEGKSVSANPHLMLERL